MDNSSVAFASMPYVPMAPGSPVFAMQTDDSYAASRFAFPAHWEPLRHLVRGNLLVTLPMRDMVLFTGAENPGGLDELRRASRRLQAERDHPISSSVFRWTATGWELFEPGSSNTN